jgi:MFS family permease
MERIIIIHFSRWLANAMLARMDNVNAAAAFRVSMAGLIALAVAMGIGRFAFTPLLPMMQAEGALTVAEGGVLAAANYVGYLAGALCAAWIGGRPDRLVRNSLVVICITTVAMGMVDDFKLWAALRCLAGAASAFALIHVTAWSLERLAALNLPRMAGVVFAGVGTGIAAAGLFCLAMMQLGVGASRSWIGLGVVAILALCLIWRTIGVGGGAPSAATSVQRPAAWPISHWLWVFCYGTFGFGYIVPATFLPAMARQALPDPAAFGWAWPVFGAAALLSTLFAARVLSTLGARRLWAASQLVMGAGVAAPLFVPGMAGILVSALLVGGTFMVATMAGMQHARVVAGSRPTQLIAAMTAAFAAGQAAGPLVVAALKQQADGGIAVALTMSCLLLFFSAIVLLLARAKPLPSAVPS